MTIDILAIVNSVTSLNSLLTSIRSNTQDKEIISLTVDVGNSVGDIQSRLLALQTEILALQTEVLTLREQNTTLQNENVALSEKVHQNHVAHEERTKYERRKFGEAWVMVPRGECEPMFCFTCFEKGQWNILQPLRRPAFGSHWCPTCQVPVPVTN